MRHQLKCRIHILHIYTKHTFHRKYGHLQFLKKLAQRPSKQSCLLKDFVSLQGEQAKLQLLATLREPLIVNFDYKRLVTKPINE